VPVAVNASARNLTDLGFPEQVLSALRRHDVPAWLLRLEITESAVMAEPEHALHVLTELRDAGVRLSIDDFGTGYSSMAYLKRLPVDELKIDRGFIRDMTGDGDDATLVRSMIDLGHNLGLTVVAEGVEDAATARALRALGCDVAQGYHYCRPVPADQLSLGSQPDRSTIH
jgi:EAL domain-containing protein (putative c-di-GMP-specific phosphodiesterase class I)